MAGTKVLQEDVPPGSGQAAGAYALINGLGMYYEVHGTGEPLLLLHGQFATIGMFAGLLPELARTRKVVAVEQQGHGHTRDIDRPLRFQQMADDTALLLEHLGIDKTDVYGYSTGGTVALQLAVRHPEKVGRIAVSSAVYDMEGYLPEVHAGLLNPRPDAFPPAVREAYEAVAPNPGAWPALVAKAGEQAAVDSGLTEQELQAIKAPVLVMTAERDVVRPEHAQDLARLLNTALVVLPDSDHASYVADGAEVLLSQLRPFFGLPRSRRRVHGDRHLELPR